MLVVRYKLEVYKRGRSYCYCDTFTPFASLSDLNDLVVFEDFMHQEPENFIYVEEELVNGALYFVDFRIESRDWETGEVDDYVYVLGQRYSHEARKAREAAKTDSERGEAQGACLFGDAIPVLRPGDPDSNCC